MMDMKEEIMSETIDDVMDEEEDEEEGDKVLKEVLDELGVSLAQQVRLRRSCVWILAHFYFAI